MKVTCGGKVYNMVIAAKHPEHFLLDVVKKTKLEGKHKITNITLQSMLKSIYYLEIKNRCMVKLPLGKIVLES